MVGNSEINMKIILIFLLLFSSNVLARKGGTNHQVRSATEIELRPANFVEIIGDVKLPNLTITLPLKLDASNNIISQLIDISSASDVTGILPIASGGTNSSTILTNDQIMVSSGGSILELGPMSNGDMIIGSTGLPPVIGPPTGTVNQVNIALGAGSLIFSTPQDIHTGATPTFVDLTLTGLTQGSALFAGVGGLISEDNGEYFWRNTTKRLGIGTSNPLTKLQIKANTPGTIGDAPAGQLIIQGLGTSINTNAVLTGYNSDGSGDPNNQLWYIGSTSSSNSDITFLNRLSAKVTIGTNGSSRLTIDNFGNIQFNVYGAGVLKTDASGNITAGTVDLTTNVTDELPIANGGTNSSTAIIDSRVMHTSGGSIVASSVTLNLVGDFGEVGSLTDTESLPVIKTVKNTASTSMLSGFTVTVNGGDAAKFDITAGEAKIYDNTTDAMIPSVTLVSFAGSTANTLTNIATDQVTFLGVNSSGTIIQQGSFFTNSQLRDIVPLSLISHDDNTIINAITDTKHFGANSVANLWDLTHAIGPVNQKGNIYSPNGANLNLDKAAGETYRIGSNFFLDNKNPNVTTDIAQVALSFNYIFRDGAGGFTTNASTTTIDPDNFDDGTGTLATVSPNKFTIQIIYFTNSKNVLRAKIEYGQKIYDKLEDAEVGINTDPIVSDPLFVFNWSVRAVLIVKKGTTNLQTVGDAKLISTGKFGNISSAGGGGGASTLQEAYDNSTNPEIILDGNGALSIQDNATPLGTDLFEVLSNVPAQIFGVDLLGIFAINADIDNVNINANTITTTDAAGDLLLDADTTGDVIVLADNILQRTNTDLDNKVGKEFRGIRNFYQNGDADYGKITNLTLGNDPVFDNGGAIASTCVISTTAADLIDGPRVYKCTQAAGSLNDFIVTEIINIPQGFRGGEIGYEFRYKYDGDDDDIEFKAKCTTSGDIITTEGPTDLKIKKFITTSGGSKPAAGNIFVKDTCTQVEVGFQVITENNTAELLWDVMKITPNLSVSSKTLEHQDIYFDGQAGHGSTATKIPHYTNLRLNSGVAIGVVDNSTTNGFSYTLSRDAVVTMCVGVEGSASASGARLGTSVNSTALTTNLESITALDRRSITTVDTNSRREAVCTSPMKLLKDDVVRPHDNGSATTDLAGSYVTIHAQAEVEVIIVPAESNLTNPTTYTPTFVGLGTVTGINITQKQIGKTLIIEGSFKLGTVSTTTPASITIPTGLQIDTVNMTGSSRHAIGTWSNTMPTSNNIASTNRLGILFFDGTSDTEAFFTINTNSSAYTKLNANTVFPSDQFVTLRIEVPIVTFTSDATVLLAFPRNRTAFIKDVKAANTNGGDSLSDDILTRDLNTLEGDITFVSLSANQFTVQVGCYVIQAKAPAHKTGNHKLRLFNFTTSTFIIEGAGATAGAGEVMTNWSHLEGGFCVTIVTVFELRHYTFSIQSPDGLGRAINQGSEVYSQIILTKLR